MSLELITDRSAAQDVELNVFVDFMDCELVGDRRERAIVKAVDQADLLEDDPYSAIDRYGRRIAVTDLSSGCLAALTVLRSPDKVVCGLQMGDNALEALLLNCTQGRVLIFDRDRSIDHTDGEIDAVYRGKRYRSTGALKRAMEGNGDV